jgi:hypothetical protein
MMKRLLYGLVWLLLVGTVAYGVNSTVSSDPGFSRIVIKTHCNDGTCDSGSITYTPPVGLVLAKIECVGGGGGGGGTVAVSASTHGGGGGGGAGGAATYVTAADIGASLTFVLGAGGAGGTTAGGDGGNGNSARVTGAGSVVLCEASGGRGGAGYTGTGQPIGGAGGDGVIGDLKSPGQSGWRAAFSTSQNARYNAALGGDAAFGFGFGGVAHAASSGAGSSGIGYGGGGAGAMSTGDPGPGPWAGAAGDDGIVVITEFIR